MSSIEKRYCKCVMKTANQYPQYNPYAICTSSIYNKQGIKRTKKVLCSTKLNFEDFTLNQLRDYARMKKLLNYSNMNKKELVNYLYGYAAKANSSEVWRRFVKKTQKEHPGLTLSEARSLASEQYQKIKNKYKL